MEKKGVNPYFVDNRDGNTLARAIRDQLQELRAAGWLPGELCIATAYFNPEGWKLLAEELRRLPAMRLLLGADPAPEAQQARRQPADPHEPEYTREKVRSSLEKLETGLRRDRTLIPFDPKEDRLLRELIAFLRSGKIEVRRYTRHFLHAKAFLFRGPERGLLAGSSNLTRAGLQSNLELNLGHYSDPLVGRVERWYEELWQEAQPFDLASLYEELLDEYPPYLVYLKILWQLYQGEITEEIRDTGGIPVTTFQLHGVWRARRILREYGGVLIADGVGLGKTFTAGELIREYRERRQRVLLVCPAALRDTTWARFLHDYQLMVECLSYEQLANDLNLGGDQRHLKSPLEDYALVVIDEAHNYRNPDAPTRAEVLRRLLAGKRRDLVMLTATPVNNSLWDLYHILRFFLRQDARLNRLGIRSIRAVFEQAMREDPFDLNPDLLFPIIDATTVKRTRRFVKKHYSNDLIRAPDGQMIPIRFPRPIALSVRYDLEQLLPGFFQRLEQVLMPARGDPLLRMARYQAESFLRAGGAELPNSAIVGLLRSALLKRFESSIEAFRRTLTKMREEHRAFLECLDRGKVLRKEFFKEISAADEEIDFDEILESSDLTEDASLYDAPALRAAVQSDLRLLEELLQTASEVNQKMDPKLAALSGELERIASQARREAAHPEDERQKRKVLIFSHYADTIDWIDSFLQRRLRTAKGLACYRDHLASVSGAEARNGVSREQAVLGFAPVSTGALAPQDQDLYDILLSTDVLAEGMNLQQCRHVINYDLPWNPMRLVQRHGRIDRINSPHDTVYLRTFFPDEQLDRLLDLEQRVRRKLAQAAASVGIEAPPLEDGAFGEQSFSETRAEIEKLRREDPSIYEAGGTEGAAQTGESYRQELRNAVKNRGDFIERLPWRVGSGLGGKDRSGWVFCAQVGNRTYLRFVPLEPESPVVNEIGTCLRLVECEEQAPRVLDPGLADGVYQAWERARRSIHESWMAESDPANIQPRVRKLNREIADFLRHHPPREMAQEQLDRLLEALESPWARREENALRLVWRQELASAEEKAQALAQEIERLGVEPFETPTPLPAIDPEEINLVCWMGIEKHPETVGR
jgi:hypothetical protein